ncbi:MAG: type II toxin-antitoxin system VapC family toxin [Propionibacteriaceae bacterium]|jgi:PIN domain nuclease of toxin-antitoxin system|nr:type II toxin-antitoxin system VapC family toxin [Propionibacteriaceae bacterium]
MRLLIDTHVFFWLIAAPEKISSTALSALTPETNQLLVSAATPWEMSIKRQAGKWPEAEPILTGYAALLNRLTAVELPIRAAHGIAAGQLTWDHKDPFDRLLAAQAMIESVRLVSADSVFDTLPEFRRLW